MKKTGQFCQRIYYQSPMCWYGGNAKEGILGKILYVIGTYQKSENVLYVNSKNYNRKRKRLKLCIKV